MEFLAIAYEVRGFLMWLWCTHPQDSLNVVYSGPWLRTQIMHDCEEDADLCEDIREKYPQSVCSSVPWSLCGAVCFVGTLYFWHKYTCVCMYIYMCVCVCSL